MQFMQMPARAERKQDGAQAICDREGQVLFVHAAPLGLSAGDFVTDRLTAAERRFLGGLPADADAVCVSRSTAFLYLCRPFDGLLAHLIPLSVPPAAVASVAELASALGLSLSPGILARAAADVHPAAEDATAELVRLCGAGAPIRLDDQPVEILFACLAGLPPLCTRQLNFDLSVAARLGGDWPVILYCLTAFLCRSIDGSPLSVSVIGSPAVPVLLLSSAAPGHIPPGRSRLAILAARFPDAPELAVCSRLAARSGIEIEIFADRTGRLSFAAAPRLDPALLGLKQPVGLSGAAEEAAEAEWCHLLRDAVQAEK